MGIEQLIGAYPPDADFVRGISRQQEFQNGRAKVVALANLFYRKGSEGLRELDRQLLNRGVVIYNDNSTSEELTPNESTSFSNNRTSVFLGALVRVFEDMLVEGEYHPADLADNYNAGFLGSGWRGNLRFESYAPRNLTTDERTNLSAMIKEDKTFITFLSGQGLRRLPTDLYYTILSSGNLPAMRSYVIPAYKLRADLLLATQLPARASASPA